MSDSWALNARFSEGAVRELSLSPAASRREQPRENVDGRVSSTSYRRRRNGRIAVTVGAFISVVGVIFLVFRCVALGRETLLTRAGRRLAGEQVPKEGDADEDADEDACGGVGSQLSKSSRRRGRSPEPLEAGPLAGWGEGSEEPPQKKKQEALEVQLETSLSPSRAVGISAEAGAGGAAEELRQSILRYVEQTLADKDEGVEPEDWLLQPYIEMQFLDEETPSQSLSTGESAAAGSPADPSTFGLTAAPPLRPGEDTAGSTSPVEGSPHSSTASSVAMSPSSDTQPSAHGAILQPEGSPAAEAASKKSVLFKYIVGEPGTKGSYMLLGSQVSNLQGRPALILLSTPISGKSAADVIPREVDFTTHPFYRIPGASRYASVRGIKLTFWQPLRRKRFFDGRLLLRIRELMKQPVLDSDGLERLMRNLEELVDHAVHREKEDISGLKPRLVVERLAFALLVTDALFAASEVLGPAARRSEWWERVIDTLPVYTGPNESGASREVAQQNILFARLLQSALAFYRCGRRPPASALVPLKQLLLCTPAVRAVRRAVCSHFLADDTEWQQSQ